MKSNLNKGFGHLLVVLSLALFVVVGAAYFVVRQGNAKTEGGAVEGVSTGFNEFGYNDTARLFNGKADGIDRVMDGKVWGDPTYANDKLVMKWNAEWDRGNAEGWTDPNGYKAWEDNEWNGKVAGGSGESWHYKIVWVGPCADGSTLPDGGYCIWGQFAVILSQGTVANQHLWDVLAKPAGYGVYFKK